MAPLPLARIQARMQELMGWSFEMNALVKEFQFPDFGSAIGFVNHVAEIANRLQHHPTILIAYTLVRITVTTHDEHGLTDKDFELAKGIDTR